MAEYIMREDALGFPFANGNYDHEHANEHFIFGCESYREWIEQIPAADVRPVARGTWLPIIEANELGEAYQSGCYCSECNEVLQYEPNFCPNCGADMRGEDYD